MQIIILYALIYVLYNEITNTIVVFKQQYHIISYTVNLRKTGLH